MRTLFDNQRPELVMFDLDGTLVDSVPDLAQAVDQMLLALGREPAGEQRVRHWVGNGAQVLVQRALSGELRVTEPEQPELFQVALELFYSAYTQSNGRHARVYDGVMPLLQQLQTAGVMQAVVTNKPAAFTHPLLSQLQLEPFFADVVSGDTLSKKKPHPAQLEWLLRKYQLTPEQVLMVGDSRNDVEAARALGCPVICVSYGYNHGEPVSACAPDRVVGCLSEIEVP